MLFERFLGIDLLNMARWYLMHLLLYGISQDDFQYLTRFDVLKDFEKILKQVFGQDFVNNQARVKCNGISDRSQRCYMYPVPPHRPAVSNESYEKVVQLCVLI